MLARLDADKQEFFISLCDGHDVTLRRVQVTIQKVKNGLEILQGCSREHFQFSVTHSGNSITG